MSGIGRIKESYGQERLHGAGCNVLTEEQEVSVHGFEAFRKRGTAYYMCKNTEYSDSVCLAVVTTEDLGREKLDLSGIGTEFQKKIDILSYDNKNDMYLLLLWCYREKDKFFENRYKKLADEMKQKLSFLDEKPLAWWVREGII